MTIASDCAWTLNFSIEESYDNVDFQRLNNVHFQRLSNVEATSGYNVEPNVDTTFLRVHKKTFTQRYILTLSKRSANVQATLLQRDCVSWVLGQMRPFPINEKTNLRLMDFPEYLSENQVAMVLPS